MRWEESDSSDSFAVDCDACGAPILVTIDDRTEERFIYRIGCSVCDEVRYLVNV